MNNDIVNAPGFDDPVGYCDAVRIPEGRRLVFLAGHVAFDACRTIQYPNDLVAQVRVVLSNLKGTLAAAGGAPEDLVKLTILVTDVAGWRRNAREIGRVWRDVLGKCYPATTLMGVAGLYDEGAVLEIEGVAAVAGC